jgi:predicted transcriptional regulator
MVKHSEIYLRSGMIAERKMLTKTQVKVILILLDCKGHAEWELAKHIRMKDSNLNPILKELEKSGIIYKGDLRSSRRPHDNKGIYAEIPYYLSQDLECFKTMIKEVAEADRPYDTGFILEIIDNSKYLKIMKDQYKEDINIIVNEILTKSDSPYSDPFFTSVIGPELIEELFCNLERASESEIQCGIMSINETTDK